MVTHSSLCLISSKVITLHTTTNLYIYKFLKNLNELSSSLLPIGCNIHRIRKLLSYTVNPSIKLRIQIPKSVFQIKPRIGIFFLGAENAISGTAVVEVEQNKIGTIRPEKQGVVHYGVFPKVFSNSEVIFSVREFAAFHFKK